MIACTAQGGHVVKSSAFPTLCLEVDKESLGSYLDPRFLVELLSGSSAGLFSEKAQAFNVKLSAFWPTSG